jgi:hypothetical protein
LSGGAPDLTGSIPDGFSWHQITSRLFRKLTRSMLCLAFTVHDLVIRSLSDLAHDGIVLSFPLPTTNGNSKRPKPTASRLEPLASCNRQPTIRVWCALV